ncbi:hypothetical protein ABE65_010320 [Fictibacillus phosphorivorans]|uniref:Uncharacterized protein n=1 Tax=Fictibacillus phosphorivorans TaxID=1221500 RepID=A0A160IM40_9BACL|nr:hypothetical protein [Fictibacillus phosphorivorans]ANC77174.1 hypothetical protein ABE65_010320 [Fictibacillus phosphorivorans]
MDWEGIKQLAFGPLNLSHDELGKLTHREFMELVEGFEWRDKYQRSMMAVHARTIMSAQHKKPLDPVKAFNLKQKKEKKKTNAEESKNIVQELEREMG